MLHHHDRNYLASLDQERLRRAAHRQLPPDAGELERVVIAASAGDQAAWSAFFARFEKHTRWVARWHGLGAHDADDVAQETMLRLFKNIARIRDRRALRGWLTTTARRESVRTSKAGQRECPTGADLGAELATADDAIDALETEARAQALGRALERLPDRHRRLMTALLAEPAPTYAEVSAAARHPDRKHRPHPRPLPRSDSPRRRRPWHPRGLRVTVMGHSIDIARSPEDVFAYMTDPSLLATWQDAEHVEQLTPGPVGVGTRFREVHRVMGRRRVEETEVVTFEPGRRFEIRVHRRAARRRPLGLRADRRSEPA